MKRLLAVLAAVGAFALGGCGHDSEPAQKHNSLEAHVQLSESPPDDVLYITVRITSSDPSYIIPPSTDWAGSDGYRFVFPQLRVSGLTGPTYTVSAEAQDADGIVRYSGKVENVNVLEGPNPTTIYVVLNSTLQVPPTDLVPVRITGVHAADVVWSGDTVLFQVAYNSDATAPVTVGWEQVGAPNPTAAFSAANEAVTTWTAPTTFVARTETIRVFVSNDVGGTDSFEFQVSVPAKNGPPEVIVDLNDPPVIHRMTLSRPRIAPGAQVVFTVLASDPNADVPTYTFDANTCIGYFGGETTVVPPNPPVSITFTGLGAGPCKLSVVITDGRGLSAQGLVTLVVDDGAPPPRTFAMTPAAFH